jgi:hypothetical protein
MSLSGMNLRVVGRSTGKHALPRGATQPPRATGPQDKPHRPKHAATMPRLTSPEGKKAAA